jgi:hypothetical protein
MAALGILTLCVVLVAQLGTWSLAERQRSASRLEAVETAANILEAARAMPWNDLTADWAAGQRLPESLARRLPGASLRVRVDPVPSLPRARRVSLTIEWEQEKGIMARPVELSSVFSARSASARGTRL